MTEKTTKNRTLLWVFIAFILGFTMPVCSCLGISTVTLWQLSELAEVGMPELGFGSGDAVAVIDLSGAIYSFTKSDIDNLLEQAASNDDVKAVVMRIDSPGGSVVASDEIYHALLDFEKPIVISMGASAASGGYYVACGGDYIIAHPDTLTGSIGVISQFMVFEELMEKYGVEAEIITSGPNKALGNPYKKMSAEEREIMENIINEAYENFIGIIAKARNLPIEDVRTIADGRIYTGRQAYELGLVDALGRQNDAIEKAAELGGITDDPHIINLEVVPSLMDILYSYQTSQSISLKEIIDMAQTPILMFR